MQSSRRLPYTRRFSTRETEILLQGVEPRGMDDHWFIFAEDDVVHLHRSWTGYEPFAIRLDRFPDGSAEIADLFVNDEPQSPQPRRRRFRIRPRRIEDVDRTSETLDIYFDSLARRAAVSQASLKNG